MKESTRKKIEEADRLIQNGDNSNAVTLIKEAIKEESNESYCYYLLGTARMKCGRLLLAKQALEKADELEPRNPVNLRGLGWLKVMLGDVEEGRNLLREAISLNWMDPLPYVDLAMSHFNWFEFDEGMEWLKRAEGLEPDNPFVLENLRLAKKFKKEYSKFSAEQVRKMRADLADKEYQKAFRISLLEKASHRKALTKDGADEVKEEARLNGQSVSVIKDYEQTYLSASNKTSSEKVKDILKKRKEIEKELRNLVKRTKAEINLEYIKELIYNEEGDDDFTKLISVFDRGGSISELGDVLDLLNNAWNYFPHKCIGGLCPMEKILEINQSSKKEKTKIG